MASCYFTLRCELILRPLLLLSISNTAWRDFVTSFTFFYADNSDIHSLRLLCFSSFCETTLMIDNESLSIKSTTGFLCYGYSR